jgi:hypothetical protein
MVGASAEPKAVSFVRAFEQHAAAFLSHRPAAGMFIKEAGYFLFCLAGMEFARPPATKRACITSILE